MVILVIIREPSSRMTSSVVMSVSIGSRPSGWAVDGGCFGGDASCFGILYGMMIFDNL